MKNIELLYKFEDATTMMVYYYDVHLWRWDAKFWLIEDKWCDGLDGKCVVGELRPEQAKTIRKYESIIEQHEKENSNWVAYQRCRKRSCICKSCDKFCRCSSCEGKIIECDEKQSNL